MIIRGASIDDVHGIATVHIDSWREAYRWIVDQEYLNALSVVKREARWAEIIKQRNSEILVADANAEIVGFSSFGRSRDKKHAADAGELYALYVTPSCWSKGVGLALWMETYRVLANRGYTSATAWVLTANQRAIRFYRKAGFKLRAGSENLITIGDKELPEALYEATVGLQSRGLDLP